MWPSGFHCPTGWRQTRVAVGNWTNNSTAVANRTRSKYVSASHWRRFSFLFTDQHPWLQEGDERWHFSEAVQEVSTEGSHQLNMFSCQHLVRTLVSGTNHPFTLKLCSSSQDLVVCGLAVSRNQWKQLSEIKQPTLSECGLKDAMNNSEKTVSARH